MDQTNSKGGILTIIIIVLIILIGTGGVLYYFYTTGVFDSEPTDTIELVDLYIRPLEFESNKNITLNYRLFEGQKIEKCLSDKPLDLWEEDLEEFYTQYPEYVGYTFNDEGCYIHKIVPLLSSEGYLYPGLNKFEFKKQTIYFMYYFSDDHYVNKQMWLGVPDPQFLTQNGTVVQEKTIYDITAHKQSEEIGINFWGDIKSNSKNNIRLYLNSTEELRHMYLCWDWSFGIVDINSDLPTHYLPERITQEVLECYKTDSSLSVNNNKQVEFDFEVETGNLIESDFIKVYVIDEDQFQDNNDIWEWGFEDDLGSNIGATDFIKIKYLNT